MPIDEYECTKCGHQTEVWQKFSDSPITQCDLCKGRMRKLISHSAFHLKGTGWYVTDYAGKNAASGSGDNGDGAKAPGNGGDAAPADASKTEAAPAAKIK